MHQELAPNKTSVSRLQTFGDLIDLRIADMCEVRKPPRRNNTATLATPKYDLGKEGIATVIARRLSTTANCAARTVPGQRQSASLGSTHTRCARTTPFEASKIT